MNLEVELIAGVLKGGLPPAHLPAPRLIKIFIAAERDGKSTIAEISDRFCNVTRNVQLTRLTMMH